MSTYTVLSLLAVIVPAAFAVEYNNERSFDNKYKFFWTYNATEENLYFKVEVDTTGWVGLGFSDQNEGMKNLDCAVGGVVASNVMYLTDYHADETKRPLKDLSQSYIIAKGSEVNGKTTMEFSRAINTLDGDDMQFTAGKGVYVAYAYHLSGEATSSSSFQQHNGGRGYSKSKIVFIPAPPTPKPTITTVAASALPNITANTTVTTPSAGFNVTASVNMTTTMPSTSTTMTTASPTSQGTQTATLSSVLSLFCIISAFLFL